MSADTFNSTLDRLRAALLAGRTVRILDIPRDDRPEAHAAMAVLQDELPVYWRWAKVSESHLSETRLTCKAYRIHARHLHDLLEALPCN